MIAGEFYISFESKCMYIFIGKTWNQKEVEKVYDGACSQKLLSNQ